MLWAVRQSVNMTWVVDEPFYFTLCHGYANTRRSVVDATCSINVILVRIYFIIIFKCFDKRNNNKNIEEICRVPWTSTGVLIYFNLKFITSASPHTEQLYGLTGSTIVRQIELQIASSVCLAPASKLSRSSYAT